ncbi:hypothetical protein B0T22DRAFT_52195 [Podospora appendiculata]|uniref:Uncharacterized protein n=1 Tax=Podospora appendiculata TaxID=314037 RepID=A0AAE0XHY1_9PEZI|nr:hypothetical protein B0T22DRAFT_52195 [Podospora appendiculata]
MPCIRYLLPSLHSLSSLCCSTMSNLHTVQLVCKPAAQQHETIKVRLHGASLKYLEGESSCFCRTSHLIPRTRYF